VTVRVYRKAAEKDGVNVDRMTAYYKSFGFEVVPVEGEGGTYREWRGNFDRVCRGCNVKKAADEFAQYVLTSGRAGRRSPYCRPCEEVRPPVRGGSRNRKPR
jgi:hypothetical protein